MAAGKKRGAKKFGHVAEDAAATSAAKAASKAPAGTPMPAPKRLSAKDARRAAVHGRAEQGMGSGGRPGGTKSSGGKRRTQGKPSPSFEAARRAGGGRKATRGTR